MDRRAFGQGPPGQIVNLKKLWRIASILHNFFRSVCFSQNAQFATTVGIRIKVPVTLALVKIAKVIILAYLCYLNSHHKGDFIPRIENSV